MKIESAFPDDAREVSPGSPPLPLTDAADLKDARKCGFPLEQLNGKLTEMETDPGSGALKTHKSPIVSYFRSVNSVHSSKLIAHSYWIGYIVMRHRLNLWLDGNFTPRLPPASAVFC